MEPQLDNGAACSFIARPLDKEEALQPQGIGQAYNEIIRRYITAR